MQSLFIDMTLTNRKYSNPINLLNNILDDKGNRIKLGDEEDVGEIGSRFMNALRDAYGIYEHIDDESSSDGENDGDTDMGEGESEKSNSNQSDEEEEKAGPNTRMNTRQIKMDIKERSYGPRALGKELYKDPQDRSRGFMQNLFFGKKIEITEQGKRSKNTVDEGDFFQVFLSVMTESNLYDSWDSAYHYEFVADDKKTYKKRNYVLSLPDVFTFQLMRATYDFKENRLKKVHSKFEFDQEIYVDRFLYQNCERFMQFREKVDAMIWNKTRLESNLTTYENKGIPIYDYFAFTKKILLDQINKERYEEFVDDIPEETDTYQILQPEDIGTLIFNNSQVKYLLILKSNTKFRYQIQ